MSMVTRIESRVPFLNYRIMGFANLLPVISKIRVTNSKLIRKKVAEKYLPTEVIRGRKSDGGVLLPVWLRTDGEFGTFAKELLSDNLVKEIERNRRCDEYQGITVSALFRNRDHSDISRTALSFVL